MLTHTAPVGQSGSVLHAWRTQFDVALLQMNSGGQPMPQVCGVQWLVAEQNCPSGQSASFAQPVVQLLLLVGSHETCAQICIAPATAHLANFLFQLHEVGL